MQNFTRIHTKKKNKQNEKMTNTLNYVSLHTTVWSDNKCVSRLARRKSHHMALSNAAAPNSECPCHAPDAFDPPEPFILEVMPPPP